MTSLQQNGVACLSSILSDPSMAETTRAEAAGVVAQMMSPLLEQYQQLAGFLEYMEDLVHSITGERQSETTSTKFAKDNKIKGNHNSTDETIQSRASVGS